ncbi:hypothetical protein ACTXGQ_04165 [Marinobacter sp. 1Y8]
MIKDFPDIKPNAEQWGIRYNTQSFKSALNGAEQTKDLPGARWTASLTFSNRFGKEARALQAFFVGLRGRSGRFWITPSGWKPNGTVDGTGELSADAAAESSTLVTTGWEAHQPELFCAGDWLEINGELKQVVVTTSSDSGGSATIEVAPPMRVAVPDGTQVKSAYPRCQMKLVEDSIDWQVSVPVIYALTVNIEEALDV